MDTLQREQDYFEAHRAEWLKHHAGKFALIRESEVAGFFDTADAAYAAAMERWGVVPVLIKPVLPEDIVEQSPALMHGLIHAGL